MRVALKKEVVHVDEVPHPDGTLLQLGSEVQCTHANVLQACAAEEGDTDPVIQRENEEQKVSLTPMLNCFMDVTNQKRWKRI